MSPWNLRHGHTRGRRNTPEYSAWMGMRRRCSYARGPMFRHYGGRGIKVCAQWESFETFLADLGPRPSGEHSIDRIDNGGDYEPGNVRWATPSEQASNKRTNRMLQFEGRSQTASAWARELGMLYETLLRRLKRGWSVDRALTERVHVENHRRAA